MNQAYYNGNFYQAVSVTAPGESPDVAPAKWRKIQLPKNWRFALSQLTYANLLKLDGQNDKAMEERQIALQTERVGLDDLVRKQANDERWLERPSVRTGQQAW